MKTFMVSELVQDVINNPHQEREISDKDYIESLEKLVVRLGMATAINVTIGYTTQDRSDILLNLWTACEIIEAAQEETS